MRRVLVLVAAVAVVVGLGACLPPETAMTITAKDGGCSADAITGKVSPASATAKLVAQRTAGGKWVDWKWYKTSDSGETPSVLTAKPNARGEYTIGYNPNWLGLKKLSGVVHFRVRSDGGGYVSNDYYVRFPKACG